MTIWDALYNSGQEHYIPPDIKQNLPYSEQTVARADALAGGDADPEAGAGPGLGVPPPPGDHGRLRAIPLQDAGGVARPGNNNINYYSGYY